MRGAGFAAGNGGAARWLWCLAVLIVLPVLVGACGAKTFYSRSRPTSRDIGCSDTNDQPVAVVQGITSGEYGWVCGKPPSCRGERELVWARTGETRDYDSANQFVVQGKCVPKCGDGEERDESGTCLAPRSARNAPPASSAPFAKPAEEKEPTPAERLAQIAQAYVGCLRAPRSDSSSCTHRRDIAVEDVFWRNVKLDQCAAASEENAEEQCAPLIAYLELGSLEQVHPCTPPLLEPYCRALKEMNATGTWETSPVKRGYCANSDLCAHLRSAREDVLATVRKVRSQLEAARLPAFKAMQQQVSGKLSSTCAHHEVCTNWVGHAVPCSGEAAISRRAWTDAAYSIEVSNGTSVDLKCGLVEGSSLHAGEIPVLERHVVPAGKRASFRLIRSDNSCTYSTIVCTVPIERAASVIQAVPKAFSLHRISKSGVVFPQSEVVMTFSKGSKGLEAGAMAISPTAGQEASSSYLE
jgi:hypothetical protein